MQISNVNNFIDFTQVQCPKPQMMGNMWMLAEVYVHHASLQMTFVVSKPISARPPLLSYQLVCTCRSISLHRTSTS